ncbi:MAG: hypothetical protein OXT65_00955 [Alphaproteobacteria bacterium]|nr:hypothetical protein [Alphaproteobacteria bacterium]
MRSIVLWTNYRRPAGFWIAVEGMAPKKKKNKQQDMLQRLERKLREISETSDVVERFTKIEAMEADVSAASDKLKKGALLSAENWTVGVGIPMMVVASFGSTFLLSPLIGAAAIVAFPAGMAGGLYGMHKMEGALGKRFLAKKESLASGLTRIAEQLDAMKQDILDNHFQELRRDTRISKVLEGSPALRTHFAKLFTQEGPEKTFRLPKPPPPSRKPGVQ